MIKEILKIAEDNEMGVIPVIDNYALQVELDRFIKNGDRAMFIMLPRQEELCHDTYGGYKRVSVEIVAAGRTPFGSSDRQDFDNVEDMSAQLKQDLRRFIDMILSTEMYEYVDRVRYTVIPYRYDSFCTAVTAQFTLTKADEPC